MYGAIIGDIVGSIYEFCNIKTKDFPFFSPDCEYTDDTIMSLAVAKAIMLSYRNNGTGFQDLLIKEMQGYGRRFPNPMGAYGNRFLFWLFADDPKPYGSYGNGSAMRVSACGLAAVSLEEAVALGRASAAVTHDHPEGIKGAEAVAAAIYLAKTGKSKEEIIKIATDGAELFNKIAAETGASFRYEYSPESFTGTEPEFALEISNAVLDVWKPTAERPVIINLPVTVQVSMPHVYANQVEYMNDNLKYRENVIISLHPHNDRGCAVADAEMGLLAGGDRIEGTLFGNGERTGNVDIVTMALNMYAQGIDPGLDFSDLPRVTELYERVTRMQVYDRTPYAGKLVFAAFSGSHQDAIAKGMKWREDHTCPHWTVPYLPIDPQDVGREYETDVIRINSQSGKGGIGYLLEHNFGYILPAKMREAVGYTVKNASDHSHKELSPAEVLEIFKQEYVNINAPVEMVDYHFVRKTDAMKAIVTIKQNGEERDISGEGNGRLDAVSNALKQHLGLDYANLTYTEHALTTESSSQAITYVSVTFKDGKTSWGAGVHDDIIAASICALICAINRKLSEN